MRSSELAKWLLYFNSLFVLVLCNPLRGIAGFSELDDARGQRWVVNPNEGEKYKITYGLEIEYHIERNPKLLEFYRPRLNWEDDGEKKANDKFWMELLERAQMDIPEAAKAKEELMKLAKDANSNSQAQFVKLGLNEDASFYRNLPETLEKEDSGTLEIKGMVFDSHKEAEDFLSEVKNRIGEGDVQGHVVWNRNIYKKGSKKAEKEVKLEGASGYIHFNGVKGMLETLAEEYDKYKNKNKAEKDSKYTPALNWNSEYLTPVYYELLENAERYQDEVVNKGKGGFRMLRAAIPALRTDKYPDGSIGFEIRTYDNPSNATETKVGSFNKVLEAMDDLSYAIAKTNGTLKMYEKFEKDFFLLDKASQNDHSKQKRICEPLISEYFSEYYNNENECKDNIIHFINQNKIKCNFEKYFEHLRKIEDKFYFPLRRWDSHPILDYAGPEQSKASKQLFKLSQEYFLAFNKALCSRDNLDAIKTDLRVDIAGWAKKAPLLPFFEAFEKANNFPSASVVEKADKLLKNKFTVYCKENPFLGKKFSDSFDNGINAITEKLDSSFLRKPSLENGGRVYRNPNRIKRAGGGNFNKAPVIFPNKENEGEKAFSPENNTQITSPQRRDSFSIRKTILPLVRPPTPTNNTAINQSFNSSLTPNKEAQGSSQNQSVIFSRSNYKRNRNRTSLISPTSIGIEKQPTGKREEKSKILLDRGKEIIKLPAQQTKIPLPPPSKPFAYPRNQRSIPLKSRHSIHPAVIK